MTLELDPRIKDRKYIFDCFSSDEAKKYIGKECYLTDWLAGFGGVEILKVDTLTDIDNNGRFFSGSQAYTYCLPVELVAPKEKKYRPYTFMEFTKKFTVGIPIKFRKRGKEGCERYLILNGYQHEQYYNNGQSVTIYIGQGGYTLQELFERYEWYEDDTGHWKPFGIVEGTPEEENGKSVRNFLLKTQRKLSPGQTCQIRISGGDHYEIMNFTLRKDTDFDRLFNNELDQQILDADVSSFIDLPDTIFIYTDLWGEI